MNLLSSGVPTSKLPSPASPCAWAAALALACGLGCVHRGASWQREPDSDRLGADSFGIVALGQPRPGRASREVAEQLDALLAKERAAGRSTLVLWLGHDFGPPGSDRFRPGDCPTRSPWLEPGMRELAATLDAHLASGGTIWGLPGPDGWRCGLPELSGSPAIAQPSAAYLIRVDASGHAELASTCTADACSIVAPASGEAPRLELVFIDPSAWIYPELDRPGSPAHAALGELDLLLGALADADPSTPRVLVSSIPIESAGAHGFGAVRARSALRWQPESVRRAIGEGRFLGVVAGLERDVQASRDLSGAIVRSNRSFLPAPLFQVVSGAAGGARPTLPVSRGNSLINELESDHAGFAWLRFDLAGGEQLGEIQVELHARVAGRWQVGSFTVPADPSAVGPLREVPPIQFCLRCDAVRGAADGEVWFDR